MLGIRDFGLLDGSGLPGLGRLVGGSGLDFMEFSQAGVGL